MNRYAVEPYEGDKPYLFISYSHKDSEQVVPFMERLSALGYRLWYDEGIDPGSEWPETIADHLSRAAACIGLISNHYLESANCRRELTFALKKQIPFLSIILEELDMPLGIEMQLSANQAVFKYKLRAEADFYKKINNTAFLQPARVLPQAEPAPVNKPSDDGEASAAAKPAPVPETPVAGTEKKPPVPHTPPRTKQKREKKQKVKVRADSGKPKKKAWLIGAIAVVLLLAVAVVATLAGNSASKTYPDYLLNSKQAERVLWGSKTQTRCETKESFVEQVSYIDLSLNDKVLNVTEFPYSLEVQGYSHPDVLRMVFFDKLGVKYIVEGHFDIVRGKLLITPCEKTYSDAYSLSGEIVYWISLHYGTVNLYTQDQARYISYHCKQNTVSGTAEQEPFRDVTRIEIPKISTGKDCAIEFSDGGSAMDAYLDTVYGNIDSLVIRWTQERRAYNGSMGEFPVNGRVDFYYINTYPCGFILVDKQEKQFYFYQNPLSDALDAAK